MPPKKKEAKDKKNKRESASDRVDFTRRPLPSLEPCDADPPPRAERLIVSAQHSFEEWDEETLDAEDWIVAGDIPFKDDEGRSCLPSRLSKLVIGWARPSELIATRKTDGSNEDMDMKSGQGASPCTEGKGAVADKGRGKSKSKDRAPSLAPALLTDAALDAYGKLLPRVLVPIVQAESAETTSAACAEVSAEATNPAANDYGSRAAVKSLPRGFKQGWNQEQLGMIASYGTSSDKQRRYKQEQAEEPPGDADGNADEMRPEGFVEEPGVKVGVSEAMPREYLTEEALGKLGAPAGGDVDPDMTAIFKAVAQLSVTSATGCPHLWEAIHPQTAEKAPCYNPSGRYLVKLFAAGRWRKVEVDDGIPLDATRSPVLAASENSVELWPSLLSKALYKLYRLGGYGVARDAAVRAVDSKGEDCRDDGTIDQVDRARFVAFALHSLTGWIPSIIAGRVPSVEEVSVEGTPRLSREDLRLPGLPPVDEEEEAARERLENRKRRQALFLHKRRKPRKVKRKVVSAKERLEINSARFKKMRGVTSKLHRGERREVYLVCIPGEPPYPVLAVCSPEEPSPEALTVTVGHKPPACQEDAVKASTADKDIALGGSSTKTRGKIPSSTPGGSLTMAAAPAAEETLPMVGFLLQWDVPARDRWSSTRDEVDLRVNEAPNEPHGRGFSGIADAGRTTQGSGVEPANGAASLASPAFRWLAPHEIVEAGGVVVRAVTRLGKGFYAEVPCHWRVLTTEVTDDVRAATATKPGKDGKTAKSSAKSKGGKGSKATAKPLDVGGATNASPLPGEGTIPEVEHPSSPAPPCAVAEGPKGTRARAPGCPPAIFLLIKPSPTSETMQPLPFGEGNDTGQVGKDAPAIAAATCARNQDTASQQGSTRESTTAAAMTEGRATASQRGSGGSGCGDPVTTTPAGGEDLESIKHPQVSAEMPEDEEETASDCPAKQGLSAGGVEMETQEEEEGEIVMCLWADQPGNGTEATQDGYVLAVLQEVLHGVPVGSSASVAPAVPAGKILLRGRHKPELDGLPLTMTSAKIRLVKGGSPKVYRVVLQPGLGCCVGFCCSHAIQTGDDGQIWKAAGLNQVTETGNYPAARAGEWRILFRRTFRVGARQDDTPGAQADMIVPSADDGSDGPVMAAIAPLAHDSQEADATCVPSTHGQHRDLPSSTATFVKAILHVSDEAARPSVRLAFVDEDEGTEMFQPLLHTNAIPLYPNINGYTVLATACSRTKPLVKGEWRLQLLSDNPLLPLDDPDDKRGEGGDGKSSYPGVTDDIDASKQPGTTIVTCQERTVYGGVYVPNKYLLFFRDVLTCASPLPFAARFRTSLPGVALCLTFLEAATGKVLRELRGSQLIQGLTVTPPQAPAHSDEETPPQKKAAKGGKGTAGAAAGESTAAPPGKLIIEAAIDRERMQVPANLVSELPYYYQPTSAALVHYVPPYPRVSFRGVMRSTVDVKNDGQSSKQLSVSAEEGCGGLLRGSEDSSVTQNATALTEATAAREAVWASHGDGNASTEENSQGLECSTTLPKGEEEELQWWLEIVGAGTVEMMHDTSRFDSENREVERWEVEEPGRASRAALLWTQHQAAKVASSGGVTSASQPTAMTAEQGAEVDEDWIKARAAALGVPVELEKERQASRATLQDYPQLARAPPRESASSARGSSPCSAESPAIRTAVTELGPEELQGREKKRFEFRAKAKNFEADWESESVKKLEAGKEEMAMQLAFIRGRAQSINAGRERFLRDRERIVQEMVAKAAARKAELAAEQEALEIAAKAKGNKQSKKGKTGKK